MSRSDVSKLSSTQPDGSEEKSMICDLSFSCVPRQVGFLCLLMPLAAVVFGANNSLAEEVTAYFFSGTDDSGNPRVTRISGELSFDRRISFEEFGAKALPLRRTEESNTREILIDRLLLLVFGDGSCLSNLQGPTYSAYGDIYEQARTIVEQGRFIVYANGRLSSSSPLGIEKSHIEVNSDGELIKLSFREICAFGSTVLLSGGFGLTDPPATFLYVEIEHGIPEFRYAITEPMLHSSTPTVLLDSEDK